MNDRTSHPALDKRAEAATWLSRLQSPARTPRVEEGFQRWLAADAAHAHAFELLTERLEVAQRLRTRSMPRRWHSSVQRHRPSFGMAALGVAATLAVVTIGSLVYNRSAGVSTEVGEQRTLALTDGSRIYLNTNTRVLVRYDDQSRRVELKSGEALFEVASQADRPFVVTSGQRQVTALGTSFIVRRDDEKLIVTLIEGKVAVMPDASESSSQAPEVLEPGQRLVLEARKAPRFDQPPLVKVTAWRRGQVALEDLTLAEAVHEMNRYSPTKLVIEQPEAGSVPVGGFFRMGDSANFARAVASTYHFQLLERGDELIIVGAPQITTQSRVEH